MAGRVFRGVDVLRQVAREITPAPTRIDIPVNGDTAHKRLIKLIRCLQKDAPRIGLGAPIGDFIDHVASVAERYGRNLFHCFDDPRIPATSNALEGFFGSSKEQLRRALGAASTTNGVAGNLGADYMVALAYAKKHSSDELMEAAATLSLSEFENARQAIEEGEKVPTLRRSRRRDPEKHLAQLLNRWLSDP